MWGLSVFDITAAVVILLFVLLVLALRWKYPHMAKLGLRNVRRRPLEAATLCIGGIVGTAAITGALVTGDSLDMMVRQQSVEALGEVDVICSSRSLVPATLFADTSAALEQEKMIDASASVILLEGSVSTGAGVTEGSVRVYGIDNDLFELGSFFSDGKRIPNLHRETCVVNSLLAEGLGIAGNAELTISIRAPENNDAFYLTSTDTLVRFNATVTDIYEMKGLGTLNLRSRTTAVRNLFVSRDYLEDVLGTPGMVNTLLLSGPGGRFDGIRRSEDIANRAEALLSERMGYREAGFQVHRESEYVVLTHRDIIFDEEKLAEIDGVGDPSALFTYFVNSVSSDDRSLSYSTVTGVNVAKDRNFGSFRYRGRCR